jgi:lysozyme
MLHPGEQVAAWIDLRNTGGTTWDTATRLATTGPRDRASAFASSDWVAPNRPASAGGAVAPGATHRFAFTLTAPSTPGSYDEHFGMVEDGVTWFSDPGQGGPADDQLEVRIVVLPAADSDAGTIDVSGGDGGPDAGMADARDESSGGATAGCGCSAPGRHIGRGGALLALAGVLGLRLRRRR